ncbi:MAG: ArsI/CadI family heavy metal resistance metalloenzyme [Amphiplicatus sp.]
MKRLHVHLKVADLDQSAAFYTALFGREPDRRESDYAKWMLDDPAANVSISARGGVSGVDHVGVQFEDDDELAAFAGRLESAGAEIVKQADAACCYARSNKYWARSPEGANWELFHTVGDSATFGDDAPDAASKAACCAPDPAGNAAACGPDPQTKAACCAPAA